MWMQNPFEVVENFVFSQWILWDERLLIGGKFAVCFALVG